MDVHRAFFGSEMSQRVFYTIDSLASTQQPLICECMRSEGARCTCPPGECHCNHLLYDTIYIELPQYFVVSPFADKSVSILTARLFDLTTESEITGSLHSDLVQVNASDDNYCCSVNKLYPIPPTFILAGRKSRFECWCRGIKGDLIELDPQKTRLVIELLLEF